MITRSGAICDVCGRYILPLNPLEMVNEFRIDAAPGQTFHCDNACKQVIMGCNGDWKRLPDGPLRQAYEKKSVELEAAKGKA